MFMHHELSKADTPYPLGPSLRDVAVGALGASAILVLANYASKAMQKHLDGPQCERQALLPNNDLDECDGEY